jgi:uncharacterized protein (DUF2236 family)
VDTRAQVLEARSVGQAVTSESVTRLRGQLQAQLRRSIGITEPPRPACDDPDQAFFAPGSIVRTVHSDLPAMLIGGLAALFLQMLHPLAMAGVAQHSNYRKDPLGRLDRTASFLGTTTFGTASEAEAAIGRVRAVHRHVKGTAPDGRPYSAGDPELVTWVHAAEVNSFLTASMIYGPRQLSVDQQDDYLDQMARVAIGLGAVDVPRSVTQLHDYFRDIQPQLRLTREARTARNFVLRGVSRRPHEITTYGLLLGAARDALPVWARRQLHLAAVPGATRLAVRPTALLMSGALRWVVTPPSTVAALPPGGTGVAAH